VLSLATQILECLEINVTLHLNTIGDVESRNSYRNALVEYFSKYRSDLSSDSQIRLDKNPMRILDSKDENDQKIAINAPKISSHLTTLAQAFFEKVCSGLESLNIAYKLDTTLVRGLDYYTHTAFEFKTTEIGAQNAICGGGRYDGLVQHMGGPAIPAVGWGMGVDRIALLLENRNFKKSAPVAIVVIGDFFEQALSLASTLREQKIICEIIYKANPGKAFKEADKLGATIVMIIGEDEVAAKTVKLKNLILPTDHPYKERTINISDVLVELHGN
jgi:histidyl-tRNA synthetase